MNSDFSPILPGTMSHEATALSAQRAFSPTDTANGFFHAHAADQLADQVLASDLMNTRVAGPMREHIGDVEDILCNDQAIGIVVGVGGFSGTGQHDVAIGLDRAEFVPTGDPGATPATGWQARRPDRFRPGAVQSDPTGGRPQLQTSRGVVTAENPRSSRYEVRT